MNDLDFIERNGSCSAEFFAQIAVGCANDYLNKKDVYIEKNKHVQYLYDLETYELEKELNNTEILIKEDLKATETNYNSRLIYSLENNYVQVDLCCENITWKEILWDGNIAHVPKINKIKNNKENFALYDIYLKIEKINGEFTKNDMINFINLNIRFEIGTQTVFKKDFFTMCLFELLDKQEILTEPDVLYFKAFTFENMIYGIPVKFLNNQEIQIITEGLDKDTHSQYKIDVIFSGKNLSSIDFDTDFENSNGFEQLIIQNQTKLEYNIESGKKFRVDFNNPVSVFFYFLYENNMVDNINQSNDIYEDFEFSNSNINSIEIGLNGHYILWTKDEIIKINFIGITLYVICIDPQLRDYNKFCSFIKNDFDPKTLKSINFSRIDNHNTIIKYYSDEDKKLSAYVNGININVMKLSKGHCMVKFDYIC